MALPEGYEPFEHLQDVYRKSANKEVARYFSDLGENWEPSIADGRSSLRWACTHQDADTGVMTQMRHDLFYNILGYGRHGLAVFHGSFESQELPVTGHPIIHFYFSQDSESVPINGTRGDADYTVRLMQLTNTSATLKTKLVEIANEIKTEFVDAKKGILLTKGNLSLSYTDVEKGFAKGKKILCNTEADGIDIIQRMCRVIDVEYDANKLTTNKPKRTSTTSATSGTQTIMGEVRKKRAYRPVANVRFRYAYASIPGEPNPIFLIDTTYRYKPLVYL